jgi:hypothetical protein
LAEPGSAASSMEKTDESARFFQSGSHIELGLAGK